MNELMATTGYRAVILRAAQDSNFDVEKLERLVAMQEAQEQREGEHRFNDAFAAAQAEMGSIKTDAANPQTRSRFATHAALDSAIHPIYTKHGFGISFTTEPLDNHDWVRVVGHLSNGIITRRYPYDAAVETTGAKGTQYTTKQWAKAGAVTYAKRQILIMMFNLRISDVDDDGAPRPPPKPGSVKPQPPGSIKPDPIDPPELVDPVTGELLSEPVAIAMHSGMDYQTWGRLFLNAVEQLSKSRADVDAWMRLNKDIVAAMEKAKPVAYASLCERVGTKKDEFPES